MSLQGQKLTVALTISRRLEKLILVWSSKLCMQTRLVLNAQRSAYLSLQNAGIKNMWYIVVPYLKTNKQKQAFAQCLLSKICDQFTHLVFITGLASHKPIRRHPLYLQVPGQSLLCPWPHAYRAWSAGVAGRSSRPDSCFYSSHQSFFYLPQVSRVSWVNPFCPLVTAKAM